MQQGVVDGALLPVGQQKAQRLSEVTQYLTTIPGGMYMGSFSVFINPDFMSLTQGMDQAWIRQRIRPQGRCPRCDGSPA
nr:hypothetical protein [Marinobacterium halophilum]